MKPSDKIKERRFETFINTTKAANLKLTHQRLEIFREIAVSDEHPDVDTIFKRVRKRVPTISHDTVYRTFTFLEKRGLLSKVSLFSDRARFDPNPEPHHHVVCIKCGSVKDIYYNLPVSFKIPEDIQNWGKINTVYIELRGICRKCRPENELE
ncbi:MAG TPA: Fur family transcriptional regulator [archaeon]|nr:Fur family transcriptional regulator [archaeon]